MLGLIIIFLIAIVADTLSEMANIPIPGSIIGLIALVLWFMFKGNVSTVVSDMSQHLVKNLALFLVPVGVSVIDLVGSINQQLVLMVVTSIAVLFVAVFTSVAVCLGAKKIFASKHMRSH